ncbi:MAG: NAD(P)H-dependent oxidoreductase [Flavobacteriales bacterium]|nr:NAD(P)H-dependent oxidoreductase [Flavobacteriales bacterium]
MNIKIVSGSTRIGRNSHRVALALNRKINDLGFKSTIVDLSEIELPAFEERLSFLTEKPERLVEISSELLSSTAYIFVTPEYNGGISASLKNFIDTFGRLEFAGKPIAVASVSTGALGGIRAAMSLQQLILAIQAYSQPQMLTVGDVEEQLNSEGEIINPSFEKKIDSFVDSFLGFAKRFN